MSILIIGLLTAVIGDVAGHFGCTVGLKDSVTALSFVALGTSVPGRTHSYLHVFSHAPSAYVLVGRLYVSRMDRIFKRCHFIRFQFYFC